MVAVSTRNRWGAQILRYGIAGGAAVAVHLAVLVGLVELFGLPKTISSLIGFCSAIPLNYWLQHSYVFSCTQDHGRFFTRYLIATLATATANTALFGALVALDVMPYVMVQILVTVFIFVVNFFWNRVYTFKSRGGDAYDE